MNASERSAKFVQSDWSGRRLHFIGIGGAGMSGLALVCARLGATVSIGAAEARMPGCDIETLLARADAALYRAKANGRNRFEAADAEELLGSAAPLVPEAGIDDGGMGGRSFALRTPGS